MQITALQLKTLKFCRNLKLGRKKLLQASHKRKFLKSCAPFSAAQINLTAERDRTHIQ